MDLWNTVVSNGITLALVAVIFGGVSTRLRRVEDKVDHLAEDTAAIKARVDLAINGRR